jgi:hypothetical protein
MNLFPGRARRSSVPRLSAIAAIAALAALSTACARPAETADTGDPALAALRQELIAMGRADQEARDGLDMQAAQDSARLRRMLELDSANSRRLRDLVQKHGWPRKSVVGEEAAQAAFLVVQHSPLRAFQKDMLALLRAAAERDDASRSDVALLVDRVRTQEGKPQLYGTQFQIRADTLMPHEIEDPAGLDARREEMGLAPMADYVARLRTTYKGPVLFDTIPLAADSTVR